MQPCIRTLYLLVRAIKFIGRFIQTTDIDDLQGINEKWFRNFLSCLNGVRLYGDDFEKMAENITTNTSEAQVINEFYSLLGSDSVFGGTRFWAATENRIRGKYAWFNRWRLERYRRAIVKLLP